MRAVKRVVGRALPIDRANVDTDQIIPAHWLKRVERTGYGAGLFEAWRRDESFVMNDTGVRYTEESVEGNETLHVIPWAEIHEIVQEREAIVVRRGVGVGASGAPAS